MEKNDDIPAFSPPASPPAPLKLPTYLVDAFTTQVFRGNPAAVCLIPKGMRLPTATLQSIAMELGYSETVFVRRQHSRKQHSTFEIRWFTPLCEVGLCGHATLAMAHVLFTLPINVDGSHAAAEFTEAQEWWRIEGDGAYFTNSFSGPLSVQRLPVGYVLDFPLRMPTPVKLQPEQQQHLVAAIGLQLADVQEWLLHEASGKYLLVLGSLTALLKATPDAAAMTKQFCPAVKPLSVTLTVAGGAPLASGIPAAVDYSKYDCVSRHFAPWVGIPEDPVTGAAHVVLGPYWSKLLRKPALRCYQASKRGGEMTVLFNASKMGRVALGGNAVSVFEGIFNVPVANSKL